MAGNSHQLEGHALSDHKWELEYMGIGDSHARMSFRGENKVYAYSTETSVYAYHMFSPRKFIRVIICFPHGNSYVCMIAHGKVVSLVFIVGTHTHTHTHTLTPNSTHTIITQLCVSMPPGWVRHAASRCGLHDIDCGACVCARMRACVCAGVRARMFVHCLCAHIIRFHLKSGDRVNSQILALPNTNVLLIHHNATTQCRVEPAIHILADTHSRDGLSNAAPSHSPNSIVDIRVAVVVSDAIQLQSHTLQTG